MLRQITDLRLLLLLPDDQNPTEPIVPLEGRVTVVPVGAGILGKEGVPGEGGTWRRRKLI